MQECPFTTDSMHRCLPGPYKHMHSTDSRLVQATIRAVKHQQCKKIVPEKQLAFFTKRGEIHKFILNNLQKTQRGHSS